MRRSASTKIRTKNETYHIPISVVCQLYRPEKRHRDDQQERSRLASSRRNGRSFRAQYLFWISCHRGGVKGMHQASRRAFHDCPPRAVHRADCQGGRNDDECALRGMHPPSPYHTADSCSWNESRCNAEPIHTCLRARRHYLRCGHGAADECESGLRRTAVH